jgi:hypothetical protein
VIASASTRAEAPFDRLATVGARHFCHSRVRTWNTVAATNQNANQDESDLWKGDSTSCDVDGKKRQTNARRMRCLNKSASGNRLGQNDPHPPAIDDKDFSGVLRGGLRKPRDQKPPQALCRASSAWIYGHNQFCHLHRVRDSLRLSFRFDALSVF